MANGYSTRAEEGRPEPADDHGVGFAGHRWRPSTHSSQEARMRRVWLFAILFLPTCASAVTFPQLALGGGYECVMLISNMKAVPWSGNFYVSQGNDALWSGEWSVNGQSFTGQEGFSVAIAPFATIELRIRGDAVTRSGYLEYYAVGAASDADVAASYFYQYFENGRLISSTGSPPSISSRVFVFPVAKTAAVNTGFAWAPDATTAEFPITFTLYRTSGSGTGAQYRVARISYSGHAAKFFDEVFGITAEGSFTGHVTAEAPEAFHLEVLRLDRTDFGFLLTSTPPDRHEPDFLGPAVDERDAGVAKRMRMLPRLQLE
jgi:hypothetical protein